jgi:hypothetical protein
VQPAGATACVPDSREKWPGPWARGTDSSPPRMRTRRRARRPSSPMTFDSGNCHTRPRRTVACVVQHPKRGS